MLKCSDAHCSDILRDRFPLRPRDIHSRLAGGSGLLATDAGGEECKEGHEDGHGEAGVVNLGEGRGKRSRNAGNGDSGSATSNSGKSGDGSAYGSAYGSSYGSGYGSGYASAPSPPGCHKSKNNSNWYTRVKPDSRAIKILTPSLVNMTTTKMRCADIRA